MSYIQIKITSWPKPVGINFWLVLPAASQPTTDMIGCHDDLNSYSKETQRMDRGESSLVSHAP
jgi:hypothetical protein